MNIGLLLPGFSRDLQDWAIPVQQNYVRELSAVDTVRVLALRYPPLHDPYVLAGAQVVPLAGGSYTRGFARLALWRRALRTLTALHRRQPFDLLHAMWADETGLIAAWAGRRLGVPVVVSVLGGELVGFADIDYGLQRSRFSRWIVGQALRGADAVIVQAGHTRRLLAQSAYAVPDARVHTIPLGVDPERFTPGTPGNRRHLIHVGALVDVKAQETLLRALALLEGVTLDIVGEGWLLPDLQALAATLGLEQRVRFVGAVAHPDLPAFYREAALHVFASRHETGPLTILEAAACGVPSVGTAVGLLPDYPALGVAVPVGDVPALAQSVGALLNDPVRLTTLRRLALDAARDELSIQQTVLRCRRLYSHLVNDYAVRTQ